MNRERLTILRDHLASLPPKLFDMTIVREDTECGTVACIAGWAGVLAVKSGEAEPGVYFSMEDAQVWLGLNDLQGRELFAGDGCAFSTKPSEAVAAIQSMLDSPDKVALPVWPEKVEA